jgi:hypothetical protein
VQMISQEASLTTNSAPTSTTAASSHPPTLPTIVLGHDRTRISHHKI